MHSTNVLPCRLLDNNLLGYSQNLKFGFWPYNNQHRWVHHFKSFWIFIELFFHSVTETKGLPWGSQHRGISLNVHIQTWFSCQYRTICNQINSSYAIRGTHRCLPFSSFLEKVTCWTKIVATLYFNILQTVKTSALCPQHLFSLGYLFQKGLHFTTCCCYLSIREPHFKADNHARLTGMCLWKEKSLLSSHI